MTAVVLAIIRDAVAAGAAIGLYLWCVWPQLRMRRASHFAFAVTAAPAVAVPAALVAELYLELPVLLVPALLTLVLATWAASGLVVRASGGARALAPDVAAASTEIGRAWERIEVGDVEEAARIVNRLNVLRTQKTGQLIDLWRRYIDEELARRGGTRLSSRDTKEEIGAELGRLTAVGVPIGGRQAVVAVLIASLIGGSPAAARAGACIAVALQLPATSTPAPPEPLQLSSAVLSVPEPGAELAHESSLDLEAAVESRVDPNTRDQLVEAGFVAGHRRIWFATDGRQINADVMEFATPAGAIAFQGHVNSYACRFSNVAFSGPAEGIGLQVRWSRGDSIEEQISWVAGSRRYLVSVTFLTPPPDHRRVINLAELAVALAGT